MTILLPIMAALVAIVFLPGISFYFDIVPKAVVVLLAAAIALLAIRFSRGWLTWALLAQAIAAMLATLASVDPWRSVIGTTWRRIGLPVEFALVVFALAIAAHISPDPERVRRFLRITVLAGIIPATYGIAQYFGFDPFLPASGYHFGEGIYQIVRPPSTLGHASYFATYLLYIVFAGGGLAMCEERRLWRTLAVLASGLATLGIILSGTRAALIGLIVGAVFLVVRERRLPKLALGATAAGILVIAALYISPAGEKLRARAFWSSEDPRGGARFLLWRDSASFATRRPVTGQGPETFSRTFAPHQSAELARAYPEFFHESPHNIFLDALSERGLLGLCSLAALCFLGLVWARGAIGAAFVAILVSQQFTVFTIPTALYFYICVALLFKKQPVLQLPQWVAVPASLLLSAFAIHLVAGDVFLATAKRAFDAGDLTSSVRFIERAHSWGAHADLFFSRSMLAAASEARDPSSKLFTWHQAGVLAERAPATADDPPNAWLNLAAYYATRDDAAAVEQALRQAIGASPNWYKPHWLLSQVLALGKRPQEAAQEARLAMELDRGRHAEVTATTRQILDLPTNR
jgi:O-antigen ligase